MSATFSEDRVYRYTLERWPYLPVWGSDTVATTLKHQVDMTGVRLETVAFVGLNPSTANETIDDPTVRRCKAFAASWGYGHMVMLNIFALRSTDPKALHRAADPVGPENDAHLEREIERASLVVCAWGTHGALRNRGAKVREDLSWITKLHILGLTKDGHPRHPLYLHGDLTPELWA